jgi:hypothetical protein
MFDNAREYTVSGLITEMILRDGKNSGENQGFILMHSVGSLPNGSEIDTPLNYADYYYLEALKRFMDLKKLRLENGEVKVIE